MLAKSFIRQSQEDGNQHNNGEEEKWKRQCNYLSLLLSKESDSASSEPLRRVTMLEPSAEGFFPALTTTLVNERSTMYPAPHAFWIAEHYTCLIVSVLGPLFRLNFNASEFVFVLLVLLSDIDHSRSQAFLRQ